MITLHALKEIGDSLLVVFFSFVLFASIILTFKLRFIQIRMLPHMIRSLFLSMFKKDDSANKDGVLPSHKALFTAMSTTLGIASIVGPAVAVRLGGPGALVGLVVALFFGSATTFAEVTAAMEYRKLKPDNSYDGGPMQYIQSVLGSWGAKIYAYTGAILLIVWSSNQSSTLGDLISGYFIPSPVTGFVLTAIVLFYLFSGLEKIGDLAAKMVPIMFVLYSGACLFIVFSNASKLPEVMKLVFYSAFSPHMITGAAVGVGIQKMLRWGLTKGIHMGEIGIGTTTIPHSQSTIQNAQEQGILAMASTYSVLFICFLSALVTLITGSWNDPSVPVGVALVAVPFAQYLPASSLILTLSAFLFALGTILGNSYNGSQCFSYISKRTSLTWYYLAAGSLVFAGTLFDVEFIWGFTDYFMLPAALLNVVAVLILVFKRSEIFKT